MSKDTSSKTNSKRMADNNDNFTGGLIIDASNGQKYKIENDKEFSIGRLLQSSLVIEAPYISRRHCTIKYEDNKFIIIDYNSHSGTFLNMKKMKKGKTNFEVLREGDLITFGEPKKMDFIYKFSLAADMNKRPRLDSNEIEDKAIQQFKSSIEISQPTLNMLFIKLYNLKAEKVALRKAVEQQFINFQELLLLMQEASKKNNTEVLEEHKIVQELIKTCECLKTKTSVLQDEHKSKLYNILENDLQCSICNEVVVKIHTANCSHSFCEYCIKQWLNKNQVCPICRTRVMNTVNSLAVDNLITNLYNLMGGTIKEQRENFIRERNESGQPKTKGRGRQKKQQPIVVTPMIRNRLGFMPYPIIRNGDIEVVDLTNVSNV